jgi:hypothetical protein
MKSWGIRGGWSKVELPFIIHRISKRNVLTGFGLLGRINSFGQAVNLPKGEMNIEIDEQDLVEVKRLEEDVLAFRKLETGETSAATLTLKGDLFLTLMELRDFGAAASLQREILAARKGSEVADNELTLISMSKLAAALIQSHAIAEIEEGVALLQSVLDIRRLKDGAERGKSTEVVERLAYAQKRLADLTASPVLGDGLDANDFVSGPMESALDGKERPLLLPHEVDGSQLVEKLEAEQSLMAIRKRLLDRDDPAILRIMLDVAYTLSRLGRLTDARELQTEVVSKRLASLGRSDERSVLAMEQLATTQQAMGEVQAAAVLRREILDIRTSSQGGVDIATMTARMELAVPLRSIGEIAEATELQRSVLDDSQRTLGEGDSFTIRVKAALAVTYKIDGDFNLARSLEEDVLRHSRNQLGDNHPDTLEAMENLAATLKMAGTPEEALKLEEHILSVRKNDLGVGHASTIFARGQLAVTLSACGREDEARQLAELNVEISRETQGDSSPSTLWAEVAKANILAELGDLLDARELASRVAGRSRKLLGPGHSTTSLAFAIIDTIDALDVSG